MFKNIKSTLERLCVVICLQILMAGDSIAVSNDERLIEEALESYHKGDLSQARHLLELVPKAMFVDRPDAEQALGILRYKEGRVKEAAEHLKNAWANGYEDALRHAAVLWLELKSFDLLEANREAIREDVARSVQTLDVHLLWYGLTGDLGILEEGLQMADDEKILAHEPTLQLTAVIFRRMIENVKSDGSIAQLTGSMGKTD